MGGGGCMLEGAGPRMEKKGGRSSARCKYMPEVRHLDIGFKRERERDRQRECRFYQIVYICVPGSEGNVNKALTSSPSPTPLSIIATARKKEKTHHLP